MLQLRDNAARPDRNTVIEKRSPKMIINLTKRERATVLAALRRWLSYPAAREADAIATSGGKHKPLDNGEIDRLYKRITELERKPGATAPHQHPSNDGREPKGLKLRDGVRMAQDGDYFRPGDTKDQQAI